MSFETARFKVSDKLRQTAYFKYYYFKYYDLIERNSQETLKIPAANIAIKADSTKNIMIVVKRESETR